MRGVHPSENEEERHTDVRLETVVAPAKRLPSHVLSCKKSHSERNRCPKPGKRAVSYNLNTGNVGNGSQDNVFFGSSSSDLKSAATQQKNAGVHQQQRNRQGGWHPIAGIFVAARVPNDTCFAHYVSCGEGDENHQ